eukprot:g1897.t1
MTDQEQADQEHVDDIDEYPPDHEDEGDYAAIDSWDDWQLLNSFADVEAERERVELLLASTSSEEPVCDRLYPTPRRRNKDNTEKSTPFKHRPLTKSDAENKKLSLKDVASLVDEVDVDEDGTALAWYAADGVLLARKDAVTGAWEVQDIFRPPGGSSSETKLQRTRLKLRAGSKSQSPVLRLHGMLEMEFAKDKRFANKSGEKKRMSTTTTSAPVPFLDGRIAPHNTPRIDHVETSQDEGEQFFRLQKGEPPHCWQPEKWRAFLETENRSAKRVRKFLQTTYDYDEDEVKIRSGTAGAVIRGLPVPLEDIDCLPATLSEGQWLLKLIQGEAEKGGRSARRAAAALFRGAKRAKRTRERRGAEGEQAEPEVEDGASSSDASSIDLETMLRQLDAAEDEGGAVRASKRRREERTPSGPDGHQGVEPEQDAESDDEEAQLHDAVDQDMDGRNTSNGLSSEEQQSPPGEDGAAGEDTEGKGDVAKLSASQYQRLRFDQRLAFREAAKSESQLASGFHKHSSFFAAEGRHSRRPPVLRESSAGVNADDPGAALGDVDEDLDDSLSVASDESWQKDFEKLELLTQSPIAGGSQPPSVPRDHQNDPDREADELSTITAIHQACYTRLLLHAIRVLLVSGKIKNQRAARQLRAWILLHDCVRTGSGTNSAEPADDCDVIIGSINVERVLASIRRAAVELVSGLIVHSIADVDWDAAVSSARACEHLLAPRLLQNCSFLNRYAAVRQTTHAVKPLSLAIKRQEVDDLLFAGQGGWGCLHEHIRLGPRPAIAAAGKEILLRPPCHSHSAEAGVKTISHHVAESWIHVAEPTYSADSILTTLSEGPPPPVPPRPVEAGKSEEVESENEGGAISEHQHQGGRPRQEKGRGAARGPETVDDLNTLNSPASRKRYRILTDVDTQITKEAQSTSSQLFAFYAERDTEVEEKAAPMIPLGELVLLAPRLVGAQGICSFSSGIEIDHAEARRPRVSRDEEEAIYAVILDSLQSIAQMRTAMLFRYVLDLEQPVGMGIGDGHWSVRDLVQFLFPWILFAADKSTTGKDSESGATSSRVLQSGAKTIDETAAHVLLAVLETALAGAPPRSITITSSAGQEISPAPGLTPTVLKEGSHNSPKQAGRGADAGTAQPDSEDATLTHDNNIRDLSFHALMLKQRLHALTDARIASSDFTFGAGFVEAGASNTTAKPQRSQFQEKDEGDRTTRREERPTTKTIANAAANEGRSPGSKSLVFNNALYATFYLRLYAKYEKLRSEDGALLHPSMSKTEADAVRVLQQKRADRAFKEKMTALEIESHPFSAIMAFVQRFIPKAKKPSAPAQNQLAPAPAPAQRQQASTPAERKKAAAVRKQKGEETRQWIAKVQEETAWKIKESPEEKAKRKAEAKLAKQAKQQTAAAVEKETKTAGATGQKSRATTGVGGEREEADDLPKDAILSLDALRLALRPGGGKTDFAAEKAASKESLKRMMTKKMQKLDFTKRYQVVADVEDDLSADDHDQVAKESEDTTSIKSKKRTKASLDCFEQSGYLTADLARRLKQNLGLRRFFPMQAEAIPFLMTHPHCDVSIGAPTGRGKTLCYLLPILNSLHELRLPHISAIVLVPTRELVTQVCDVVEALYHDSGPFSTKARNITASSNSSGGGGRLPTIQALFSHTGGSASTFRAEKLEMKRVQPDIVVATPGKLIEHFHRGILGHPAVTTNLKWFVVDESDRLLRDTETMKWLEVLRKIEEAKLPWKTREFFPEATIGEQEDSEEASPGSSFDDTSSAKARSFSSEEQEERKRAAAVEQMKHDFFSDPFADILGPDADLDVARAKYSTLSIPLASTRSSSHSPRYPPVPLRKILASATLTKNPGKLALLRLEKPFFFVSTQSGAFSVPDSLVQQSVITRDRPQAVATWLCTQLLLQQGPATASTASNVRNVIIFCPSVDETHKLCRFLQIYFLLLDHYLDPKYRKKVFRNYSPALVNKNGEDESGGKKKKDKSPYSFQKAVNVHEFSSALPQADRAKRLLEFANAVANEQNKAAEHVEDEDDAEKKKEHFSNERSNWPNKKFLRVLVCSDVAARGLDLPNVDAVVNVDVPKFLKTYIHRVGRTARGGKVGKAVTMVTLKDVPAFKKMLKESDFGFNAIDRVSCGEAVYLQNKDFKIKAASARAGHNAGAEGEGIPAVPLDESNDVAENAERQSQIPAEDTKNAEPDSEDSSLSADSDKSDDEADEEGRGNRKDEAGKPAERKKRRETRKEKEARAKKELESQLTAIVGEDNALFRKTIVKSKHMLAEVLKWEAESSGNQAETEEGGDNAVATESKSERSKKKPMKHTRKTQNAVGVGVAVTLKPAECLGDFFGRKPELLEVELHKGPAPARLEQFLTAADRIVHFVTEVEEFRETCRQEKRADIRSQAEASRLLLGGRKNDSLWCTDHRYLLVQWLGRAERKKKRNAKLRQEILQSNDFITFPGARATGFGSNVGRGGRQIFMTHNAMTNFNTSIENASDPPDLPPWWHAVPMASSYQWRRFLAFRFRTNAFMRRQARRRKIPRFLHPHKRGNFSGVEHGHYVFDPHSLTTDNLQVLRAIVDPKYLPLPHEQADNDHAVSLSSSRSASANSNSININRTAPVTPVFPLRKLKDFRTHGADTDRGTDFFSYPTALDRLGSKGRYSNFRPSADHNSEPPSLQKFRALLRRHDGARQSHSMLTPQYVKLRMAQLMRDAPEISMFDVINHLEQWKLDSACAPAGGQQLSLEELELIQATWQRLVLREALAVCFPKRYVRRLKKHKKWTKRFKKTKEEQAHMAAVKQLFPENFAKRAPAAGGGGGAAAAVGLGLAAVL